MQKGLHHIHRMPPARPPNLPQSRPQLWHILQLMPDLRTDYARNHHQRHHIQRIGVHAIPAEVLVQNHRCHHRCQPQHQPERAQLKRTDMNIGVHNPRSLQYKVTVRSASPPPPIRATLSFMQTTAPELSFPPASDMEILFTRQQIADRTREIGAQITADYEGKSIVLIGVLKGAAIFLADLAPRHRRRQHL